MGYPEARHESGAILHHHTPLGPCSRSLGPSHSQRDHQRSHTDKPGSQLTLTRGSVPCLRLQSRSDPDLYNALQAATAPQQLSILSVRSQRDIVCLRLDAQLGWVASVSKMGSPALFRNPERADLVFTKCSMGRQYLERLADAAGGRAGGRAAGRS